MVDAINYQMQEYNRRPNFILHVLLCHPGLHFRSLSMKCDVERTALSRGYSMIFCNTSLRKYSSCGPASLEYPQKTSLEQISTVARCPYSSRICQ
jgi:hypothetical protein